MTWDAKDSLVQAEQKLTLSHDTLLAFGAPVPPLQHMLGDLEKDISNLLSQRKRPPAGISNIYQSTAHTLFDWSVASEALTGSTGLAYQAPSPK